MVSTQWLKAKAEM
ncbi:hypothetical protein Taro_032900 [Colocasia esculenta]|uniref:Uncharacterized protein n=1 Tax=Colocasia esculenta TaxID=4460 RepID=A0A843VTV8_COLES|nr:hypothetical protein [Colocasia esculenta]